MSERGDEYRRMAGELLRSGGITLAEGEEDVIEIADFGLGDFRSEGLALLTYVNTDRYCAKELVLFPHQTCPQHRHPPVGDDPGKEETFRCRAGSVRLFVDGAGERGPDVTVPAGSEDAYSVWSEIALEPGQQHTIPPDTWHWFQAGPEGAIVSEFSSTSRDELDVFLDPRVVRVPAAEEPA